MYQKIFKSIFDSYFSIIFLIILFPLFIALSILILCINGWPILFAQERPGKNNKIFKMYKFRTMTNKKDKNGNLLPDDQRLTKFGNFLRKSSIDELPSLINIAKGDMSFVGPRPLLIKYLPYYTNEEQKRHSVRPGLTGLSQVNGRNLLNWDKRLELDIEYVENITLVNDLKILIKTAEKVLKRSDIVVGKEHIMEDFDVEREKLRSHGDVKNV
ncbi:sugar transferase [Macrococcoides canis]|uniref:sugar transferase n=1 Tax=Macrococcoides canis TaxID=1855823 RepID=UPI001F2980AA|nr:sugar transferase [Macrococcus canis]UJS28634.1 sugar transferase [Macrococcus canis]